MINIKSSYKYINIFAIMMTLAIISIPHFELMSSSEYTFGFPLNIFAAEDSFVGTGIDIIGYYNLNNLGINLLVALIVACGLVKLFNSVNVRYKILAESCYRGLLLSAIALPIVGGLFGIGASVSAPYSNYIELYYIFIVVFILVGFIVHNLLRRKVLVKADNELEQNYWLNSRKITIFVSILFLLSLYFFCSI